MKWAAYILPFLPLLLPAQNINLHLPGHQAAKREIWMDATGLTALATAGAAHGIREAMHAEPGIFGTGEGYWQDKSWKRKYRDYNAGDRRPAFPGSTSVLAWATDGYHLAGAVDTAGKLSGTVLLAINEPFSIKKTGIRLAAGFILYGLTSHVTYNHIRHGKPF